MRPRYYCEFCKKANGSPSHMKKHEAGCTNNPNRLCGLCRNAAEKRQQRSMVDLLAALKAGGLGALRKAAGNCPACILAAARQGRVFDEFPIPDEWAAFNFKDERETWWKESNDAQMRESYPY